MCRPRKRGSGSEESSIQSSCTADDQQLLLRNSTGSNEERAGRVSGSDARMLNGVHVTQRDRECSTSADIELQHLEESEDLSPTAEESRGLTEHRGQHEDTSSGGVSEDGEMETDAQRQGNKRKGSLVPFYNRRPSFTPSFFKPVRLFPHKRLSGAGYTSMRGSRQRLVFEEEEDDETVSLPQREPGEVALEEGRGVSEDGEDEREEREEGEERVTTRAGRVCAALKKTLQNLKLFLT